MIVLDTHVLIWWTSGDTQLSAAASARIGEVQREQGEILISSISAWEIAMLVARNRLTLSMDVDSWLNLVGRIEGVRFVPVDNRIALESTRLPGEFHKDPADRMIVALARTLSAPLLTADEKIRAYAHVRTVW
jgi:PIN domain nuclease of toxin-antitoxin system